MATVQHSSQTHTEQVSFLITEARIAGPQGLPAQLFFKGVEWPEDQRAGVEEDGEHGLPL